ncbi:MAG: YCF48-related protein, partial [Dehalococcoidia bacterium]
MGQYAVRRFLLIFPTLLIVSVLTFLMVALLPGDAVDAVGARGGGRSEQSKETKRARLGLDRAFHVQFVSWLIGWPKAEGIVGRTGDAGETWEPLSSGPLKLFNDVEFIDVREGWAAADRGGIFHSTNGGAGWLNQLKGNDNSLFALTFVDSETGWAVGDKGAIFHTRDAGETWLAQSGGTERKLRDVVFLDAGRGWSVGDHGTILSTSDGGITWIQGESGVEDNLSALAFTDENNGWAVGEHGVILRTGTGGITWRQETSGTSKSLNSVHFIDLNTGWAAGDDGLVLATSNGGRTWEIRDTGTDVDLSSVEFRDSLNGSVVGDQGLVLHTFDGGHTWVRQILNELNPVTKPLKKVFFISETRGWAVGWDRPWQWGILGGNLGRSLLNERTAAQEIKERLPRSLELMALGMFIAVVLGIPIGVLSAVRQDSWGDYLGRSIAIIGLSVPAFWLATLAILLPSVWWKWTPPIGWVPFTEDPVTNLTHLALPAFIVGFATMASIMRMTRATMLEVVRQDYIRTAWAKGLKERMVVARHALRNALIPVVTLIGMQIPFIMGESVVIELIFNIPGIAQLS